MNTMNLHYYFAYTNERSIIFEIKSDDVLTMKRGCLLFKWFRTC